MSAETVEVPFPAGRRLRVLKHRAEKHDFAAWEREYVEALVDVLRPGMVVFDVGAEEGEFSALAGQIVGGKHVHLFEPTPGVWRNIREVWGGNDLDGPGGCWQGFVGAGNSARSWERLNSRRGGWPASAEGPIQLEGAFSVLTERPDIPTITLDDYAATTGWNPDVVMIDVEGAETLVAAGMASILARARPLVFVSVHPPAFLERFGAEQEHLFRLFARAGYIAQFISHDHESHWLMVPTERR